MIKTLPPLEESDDHGQRAGDVLANRIEQKILGGEFADNQPLPAERDLMSQFNVSRTVVRDAISTLSSRGLLQTRPRYRPLVRKPDFATVLTATGTIVRHMMNEPGGVKNLYESRVFMERALVREAALFATKDDIQALKEALTANEAAIPHSLTFYETDMAFHGVLYRVAKNPIFPVVHEGYKAWLAPHWRRMQRSRKRNEFNFRAHKAIYDGILERDPVRAEEALITHMKDAWMLVRDTFDLDENDIPGRS